jgi:EmrB/QacA subfamily drug resistance transporter
MAATDTQVPADLGPEAGNAPLDNTIDKALLMVAGVVVLGAVMSILDTTVVNVAVNTLANHFHTTLPTIQWVATGYTLALATVIPLTGWIADRFGTKRLYMISIGLFVVGSSLSGLAWSSGTIILFRVLQGLGGGMIMPAGMTIMTRAAGPHRIGRVMGIMGVPMLLAPIIGPILGGWLVTDVSWRWIFFINLPVGIVALISAMRVLPRDVAAHEQKLDIVDLLLLSPGLALFIYGLAESDSAGGFGSGRVLIPMLVGIALIATFVWHALHASDPLIDLRLFTSRVFTMSSLTLVLFCISVFGSFLLLPLYFQAVRGESALQSGLLLAPQGLGAMIGMPIAGVLSDKTGSGRIVPVGMIPVVLSVLWLTQIGPHTSYVLMSVDLFVFGIGMGLAMMPVFTGALQSVVAAAAARANTALNILQQTGASIGTAVLTVLLAHALTSKLGSHGSIGSAAAMTPAQRAHIAGPMAAAWGQTFWWAVGLLVIALLASLTLPKSKPELPEGGIAHAAVPV